ncbi:unnamed protein product [Mucor hiemalis]
MGIINIMWELKEFVNYTCSVLDSIVKSHSSNEKNENRQNLTDFLVETVDVKLPSRCVFGVDEFNLSSSPLRPPSFVNSVSIRSFDCDSEIEKNKDNDYEDN